MNGFSEPCELHSDYSELGSAQARELESSRKALPRCICNTTVGMQLRLCPSVIDTNCKAEGEEREGRGGGGIKDHARDLFWVLCPFALSAWAKHVCTLLRSVQARDADLKRFAHALKTRTALLK